jgi:hypothetical protein
MDTADALSFTMNTRIRAGRVSLASFAGA